MKCSLVEHTHTHTYMNERWGLKSDTLGFSSYFGKWNDTIIMENTGFRKICHHSLPWHNDVTVRSHLSYKPNFCFHILDQKVTSVPLAPSLTVFGSSKKIKNSQTQTASTKAVSQEERLGSPFKQHTCVWLSTCLYVCLYLPAFSRKTIQTWDRSAHSHTIMVSKGSQLQTRT